MSLLDKYEATLQKKTLLEMYEDKMNHTLLDTVSPPELVLNEKAFKEFTDNHRQHQLEAIQSTEGNDRKQIIIPTGTGKTRLQIHLHVQDMIEKTREKETGVYVIGAHRLLLCKQLMDELQDLCVRCGLSFNTLYIGSAQHDDKPVYDKYFHQGITSDTFSSTYTIQTDEVLKFYQKTKTDKRHLIIVSTYHSFHKMKKIEAIDITTYDESHTLTSKEFRNNIDKVIGNIKRNYFFTATRKGMDDLGFFGEVWGVPPIEMIKAGEIVEPKIHTMSLKDSNTGDIKIDDDKMLIQTIIEGFSEHKKKLIEASAHPEDIGAKLLVSCKGSDELNSIQESEMFQAWCKDNNIKVFSFSSKYGSFESFSEKERMEVYNDMKALKDTDDCILLHIDILAEGIDLPSVTAVMPLRHLNLVKLLQTFGRALRLLKSDRNKLYAGEMKPEEKEKFTKPYAYLMLPLHFNGLNEKHGEMQQTIEEVVNTYKLPTEEFLPLEEFISYVFDYLDPVTDKDKIDELMKKYPLLHVIRNIIWKNFLKDYEGLSKQEKYDYLIKLLKKHGETDA